MRYAFTGMPFEQIEFYRHKPKSKQNDYLFVSFSFFEIFNSDWVWRFDHDLAKTKHIT